MWSRLIPRDDAFEDLLVEIAQHIVIATNLLAEMLGQDPAHREQAAAQISRHELSADETVHRLLGRVNSSVVTPFDREDIVVLAQSLDECLDLVENAADLLVLLHVQGLPVGVSDLLAVLQRQAELTLELLPNLRHSKDHAQYWLELNRLENQANKVHRRLLAELLGDGARVYGSIEAMLKVREIIDQLEACANAFEFLASRVEIIAVKGA